MDESSGIIEFVDQYYRMNPETEDVLFDGTYLRNGMVVLVESPYKRAATATKLHIHPDVLEGLLVKNRWCTVEKAQVIHGGEQAAFIGVYDDGIKVKRVYDVSDAWIVKLDSIPAIVNQIAALVSMHYEMDPATERLLPDASYFEDGMRVLSDSLATRCGVRHDMTSTQLAEARITNRWCAVKNLRAQDNGSFRFTATYDDGLVTTRTAHSTESWLVKVDSISSPLWKTFQPTAIRGPHNA